MNVEDFRFYTYIYIYILEKERANIYSKNSEGTERDRDKSIMRMNVGLQTDLESLESLEESLLSESLEESLRFRLDLEDLDFLGDRDRDLLRLLLLTLFSSSSDELESDELDISSRLYTERDIYGVYRQGRKRTEMERVNEITVCKTNSSSCLCDPRLEIEKFFFV